MPLLFSIHFFVIYMDFYDFLRYNNNIIISWRLAMEDKTIFEHQSHIHQGYDMGIYYCGKRVNTINHVYGPRINDHYLIVLVNEGQAILHGKTEILLKEHDLFVMHPGEKIHYTALTPWSIQWVGLYGKAVDSFMTRLNIRAENPIMHVSQYRELEIVLEKLYTAMDSSTVSSEFIQISLVYKFFSILFDGSDAKNELNYATTAKKIIDYNFSNGLTVSKLANELCLSTAYFTRLFTKRCGIPPKQYIIKKQISKAKELLAGTNATICEVANSVGFSDQMYFSRIFKKEVGLTPSEYRISHSLLSPTTFKE